MVATETGVALLDEADDPTILCEVAAEPGIRMNEGGCDPQGRFWCGTMAYDARAGAGSLYRVEPDGSFATALAGVTISNGLGWSPDGATAFYVDSTAQRIDSFAFDGASGELGERSRFTEIDPSLGLPDGLAIDAEGGVWVALWDGAGGAPVRARRNAGRGRAAAVRAGHRLRVRRRRLSQLFITTSRLELPDGVDPAGGSLFRCEPGVRGQAVLEFAG